MSLYILCKIVQCSVFATMENVNPSVAFQHLTKFQTSILPFVFAPPEPSLIAFFIDHPLVEHVLPYVACNHEYIFK